MANVTHRGEVPAGYPEPPSGWKSAAELAVTLKWQICRSILTHHFELKKVHEFGWDFVGHRYTESVSPFHIVLLPKRKSYHNANL